jgi:2-polyprenyl-3-methyl-5-hydroxy-6-metoxy-1,4-benzoquinol methylase
MRYYQEEHETAYRRIEQLGHTQWNDLFEDIWTYDHFQNRGFLEQVLPLLDLPAPADLHAFEYGCGTGPAACFLAAQGFHVDAVDLIPEAIAIAQRMAHERGLTVAFSVADICSLPSESPPPRHYDLVLDSYCLQSIVTDRDRAAVFAAVRARLKPTGFYVISTALQTPERVVGPGYMHDPTSGITWREVPDGTEIDQATRIDGTWYLPYRRHLTAEAVQQELARTGFHVLDLTGVEHGDVVCRLTG